LLLFCLLRGREKELNQWLASCGRKIDQREESSAVKGAGACCSDGQRTGKRGKLSGGGLVRLRAGEDWLLGSGAKQSGIDGSGAGADMLSRARTCGQTWTRVQNGTHPCKPRKTPRRRAGTSERDASKIRGAMRWFCLCTHVRDRARAKMAPCPPCA
jgi:hypothetical protein